MLHEEINDLDINVSIVTAPVVYKQKVFVKPIEHHYENEGEKPYIKYSCPNCEKIAAIVENIDDDEAEECNCTFIKSQVLKGESNCWCCGVNFIWE